MAVQTCHILVPKSLFSVIGDKTMFKIITIMEMHTLRRSINNLTIAIFCYILQVAYLYISSHTALFNRLIQFLKSGANTPICSASL